MGTTFSKDDAEEGKDGDGHDPGRGGGPGGRSGGDGAGAGGGGGGSDSDEPETGEKMGILQQIKFGYAEIVNAIIRPPRAEYTMASLGPKEFTFRGRRHVRTDLQLTNARGLKLECSHWQPHPDDRPGKEMPCVIYLHGNSSCRIGALENLEVCLSEGITLFALDTAGSGKSEGEWVTLGWFERDDVTTVTDHLRSTGTVSTIGLWGRSMGAATALLHGHRDPSIAGMILDSPFADLRQLANEMVAMGKAESGMRVPNWVISAAIKLVRKSVLSRAQLDINDLVPAKDVDKCFIPALFAAAEDDSFIAPHHSQQIYDSYAGDKNIVMLPGEHNSPRPKFFQDSCGIFLRNALRVPTGYALSTPAALGAGARAPDGLLHSWVSGGMVGGGGGDDDAIAATAALEEEMMRRAMLASLMIQGGPGGAGATGGASPLTGAVSGGASGRGGGGASADDHGLGFEGGGTPPSTPGSKGPEPRARPAALDPALAAEYMAGPPSGPWVCATCTLQNVAGASVCDACGTPAPPGSASASPAGARTSPGSSGSGSRSGRSISRRRPGPIEVREDSARPYGSPLPFSPSSTTHDESLEAALALSAAEAAAAGVVASTPPARGATGASATDGARGDGPSPEVGAVGSAAGAASGASASRAGAAKDDGERDSAGHKASTPHAKAGDAMEAVSGPVALDAIELSRGGAAAVPAAHTPLARALPAPSDLAEAGDGAGSAKGDGSGATGADAGAAATSAPAASAAEGAVASASAATAASGPSSSGGGDADDDGDDAGGHGAPA